MSPRPPDLFSGLQILVRDSVFIWAIFRTSLCVTKPGSSRLKLKDGPIRDGDGKDVCSPEENQSPGLMWTARG
jgi:hypothetical protein